MFQLLGELVPVLVAYKFPLMFLLLTVAFICWKYVGPDGPQKAAPQDSSLAFRPVPLEAEDEVDVRKESVNADIQDMRMQRKIRMRAGWKTRDWVDSELMPPKSRRWDGIHQQ